MADMFAVPFEEIAPVVGRSPEAARQLASRARRRVQGAAVPDRDLTRQRAVVDAFFAAARGGDFDALVAVLDPNVVLRADSGGGRPISVVRLAERSEHPIRHYSQMGAILLEALRQPALFVHRSHSSSRRVIALTVETRQM